MEPKIFRHFGILAILVKIRHFGILLESSKNYSSLWQVTLEGSLMPLAVKFSGGSRKRSRTDFDAPANGNCPTSKPYDMDHMIWSI